MLHILQLENMQNKTKFNLKKLQNYPCRKMKDFFSISFEISKHTTWAPTNQLATITGWHSKEPKVYKLMIFGFGKK